MRSVEGLEGIISHFRLGKAPEKPGALCCSDLAECGVLSPAPSAIGPGLIMVRLLPTVCGVGPVDDDPDREPTPRDPPAGGPTLDSAETVFWYEAARSLYRKGVGMVEAVDGANLLLRARRALSSVPDRELAGYPAGMASSAASPPAAGDPPREETFAGRPSEPTRPPTSPPAAVEEPRGERGS
jgi:hypothetical protein